MDREKAVEAYKKQWTGGPSTTRLDGFKDGYDAAMRDNDWHPILSADDLPKESGTYLTKVSSRLVAEYHTPEISITQYRAGQGPRKASEYDDWLTSFEAWMPIPEYRQPQTQEGEDAGN